MRKLLGLIAFVLLSISVLTSCDSSLTYANQLESEKESIRTFIKNNNIKVVDTIPSVVPWPDGVYYLTESGLYVHVVDTGLCVNKSIKKNTVITVRFYERTMEGEEGYTNMYGTADPVELLYDNVSESSSSSSTANMDCKAWHEGLDYVGDKGCIQMIVPASLGWSMYTTSTALKARYYELRYTFWK